MFAAIVSVLEHTVSIKEDVVFGYKAVRNYDALAYCSFLRKTKTHYNVKPDQTSEVMFTGLSYTFREAMENEVRHVEQKRKSIKPFVPTLIGKVTGCLEGVVNPPQGSSSTTQMILLHDYLKTLEKMLDKKTHLYADECSNAIAYAKFHQILFSETDWIAYVMSTHAPLSTFMEMYETGTVYEEPPCDPSEQPTTK